MKQSYKLELSLLVLFFITFFLIVAQEGILRNTITIAPQGDYYVDLYSDNLEGGSSETELKSSSTSYDWQCNLSNDNISYPYCGFLIFFDQQVDKGIDLSQYKKLRLWLEYKGDGENIRISLKNFNSEYSNLNQPASLKHNQLDIHKSMLKPGLEVDLVNFSVPTWWILNNKIPLKHSGVELSNVSLIDIQTGSDVVSGHHEFKLTKIEIEGQLISTEKWYLSILSVWLCIWFVLLVKRIIKQNKEISYRKQRELDLKKLNLFLDQHTKELIEESKKDHLTGAFNRQGVEDAVARALVEWQENKSPLAIVMLDIDHFKQINDVHGHAKGDEVLMALTRLVQKSIRSTDRFARWGGEEFVLVCRNTTAQEAFVIANKLRQRLADVNLVPDISVTASFGVADIKGNCSIEDVFELADKALYRAKNNGRNKVELA